MDGEVAKSPKPVGPYRRARRAFGRWRRSAFDPNNLAGRLEKQRSQINDQNRQLAELKRQVEALRKRIQPVEHASNHREVEHGNLTIQVGVWEQRLGRLEELMARHPLSDVTDIPEGRSLLEEIRRQHEQIRVRMQVIAQYEERLRRVEEALVKLYHGDVRHPF